MNTRVRKFAMHALSYCCLLAVLTFSITSAAWGDLTTSFTLDGNVGVEVAAFPAGFASMPSGTLTLSSIPAGATINHAALYAINYFASVTPSATFAGTSLGSTSAFDTSAFGGLTTYKWNVPIGLITGNGGFSASATGLSNNYGLALVVVFSHPSLPLGRVIVNDGATNLNGDSPNAASTAFSLASGGTGTLWIHTGADNAGQSGEVISFNGSTIGGPIDANLGEFASLFQFSVTTVAGTNTAHISALSGDHFGWDLAVLSTTIPEAIISTAVDELNFPFGVAVRTFTPAGATLQTDVYIADRNNHVVWKVTGGVRERVAGILGPGDSLPGEAGYNGDGILATAAQLNSPTGVALANGNLYIADSGNHALRKVNVSAGSTATISTVAGTPPTLGLAVNGGPATSATLFHARSVAVDGDDNIYIADWMNQQVRMVDVATGIITAVAGVAGETGNNDGPVAEARLNSPLGVAVNASGSVVYVADEGNHKVRKVDVSAGEVTTVAGTGISGFSGDNGLATAANLDSPSGVALDAAGNLYIADTDNHRIRRVSSAGVITTVAGTGAAGFSGDGGPATAAQLDSPVAVAVDGVTGDLYIADLQNQRIRKVDFTP